MDLTISSNKYLLILLRDISIFLVSKKSFSGISMPANKSVQKSSAHLGLMVTNQHKETNISVCCYILMLLLVSFLSSTFIIILALKKMVVNHIDKTFVTSDAATILKELEVQHPAAKMLQMACKMQEE